MGEMVTSVELENTTDRDIASEGLRDRSTIRRTTVEGVVDTGLAERKRWTDEAVKALREAGFDGMQAGSRHRSEPQRGSEIGGVVHVLTSRRNSTTCFGTPCAAVVRVGRKRALNPSGRRCAEHGVA